MADMRESNEREARGIEVIRSVKTSLESRGIFLEEKTIGTILGVYECQRPNEKILNTDSRKHQIKMGLDVDVSDALTGLKAITREAKKATEAFKGLEEQQRKMKVDWYEVGGQHVHRVEDSIPHSQQLFDVGAVAKEMSKQFSKELADKIRNKGIKY